MARRGLHRDNHALSDHALLRRAGTAPRGLLDAAHGAPARDGQRWRRPAGLVAALAAVMLIAAPLIGWPPVVRLPAVLLPTLAVTVLMARPWRWGGAQWDVLDSWLPSTRQFWTAAGVVALVLFWIVFTRFKSAEINAVDFTVYFDRPCLQTVQGRVLAIETADLAVYSHHSGLEHHAYWALVPLCGVYALGASPLWLLAVSVLAVVAGAVHVFRIMRWLQANGVLAAATALAYCLNDNTARALNYGFHPELLYAWCVPWLIDAGLRMNRRGFVGATIMCVAVKEDALLPLIAVSSALALHRGRDMTIRERLLFLVAPGALAIANLAIYYEWVIPALTGGRTLTYGHFWGAYGPTPGSALWGMARAPWRVAGDVATSGLLSTVLPPHLLLLPLVGWRWTLGTLPVVVLFGSATNDQLRQFGIYYAIVLVPFLVLGAAVGAWTLAGAVPGVTRRTPTAAGAVLLGALAVGSGDRGYSLRPWRAEVAALPAALATLDAEPVVLVQSGLYPHAGYDPRLQLLTHETLAHPDSAGAPVLIAPALGAYPLTRDEIARLGQWRRAAGTPAGLLTVWPPMDAAHPLP